MTSKYATLIDVTDSVVIVDADLLAKADVYVDAALFERDINPDDVALPQPLLTQLTVLHACRIAAIEQAVGENTMLIDKAKQYQQAIDRLQASLTRQALGVAIPTSGGYGSFKLERG